MTMLSREPEVEQLPVELFDLIWQETSVLRRHAHEGFACPTANPPYGSADPMGRRVDDACLAVSCLDMVHDVYAGAAPRLRERLARFRESGELKDAVRYVHSVVRNEVRDMGRRWRLSRGLPAKPSRSDGVAARVIQALRARAADEAAAEWSETLFRMVRSYACQPGRPDRDWPLDHWAEGKRAYDGREPEIGSDAVRAEIAADISHVLSTATEIAGDRWVYDNIIGPLRSSADPQPLDALDMDAPAASPTTVSYEDDAMAQLVRSEYAGLRAKGIDLPRAVREAVAHGYGYDVPQSRCADDAVVDWLEHAAEPVVAA